MSDFTVVINHSTLDLRLGKLAPSVRDHLRDAAETLKGELVDAARALAPVKTGHYRDSIKGSVRTTTNRVDGKVYSRSPLAHIIESGARIPPHDILPSAAEALHFRLGGGADDVFTRFVHSPGAELPARHPIEGAFETMQDEIQSRLEEAARSGAREI